MGNGRSYYDRYGLGGTPLLESYLCLDSLVANFKNNTQAEIVTVVYFTDGGASYYLNLDNESIVHDPKTKINYDLKEIGASSSNACKLRSDAILKIVRNRMKNVNVLNFYITSDLFSTLSGEKKLQILAENNISIEDYNKDYRKISQSLSNKYLVFQRENPGSYDAVFDCSINMFEKPKAFAHDMDAKNDASGIVDAFMVYSSRKKQISIMISKFIDLIV
jgi:hypothetical protein